MSRRAAGAAVLLLFVVLTAAMTWPQITSLSTRVYDSDDPLLSIWRISWIAHILPTSPGDVLNGNIFYPEPRTLAYTDSALLEGLAAAPLIWLGASRVTTYNVALLLSIALSGWAMWRYALYMTGHHWGAVLAGITFAFVPFRFDHFHHLELQATIFLPLTLLFFERALDSGSRRDSWLMAAAFVAQVYSCIYYSIFLATVLMPIAAVRIWLLPAERRVLLLRAIAPAAIVALVVVAPYGYAYALNRATLGERLDRDILLYSATWPNYFATTPENVIHGEWSAGFGQSERFLFPGFLSLALMAGAFWRFDRRPSTSLGAALSPSSLDPARDDLELVERSKGRRATLVAIGGMAFIISLGLNSPFYEPLRAILLPYRGLRAPARAAILLYLAIAALGAYGWARLMRGRGKAIETVAAVLMAIALLLEYRTNMTKWLTLSEQPPEVYHWLATQPRSVVAEVPFSRADRLDSIPDGLYMFNSTWHWQPIVNGYSGFYPKTFMELAEHTKSFPDEHSMAYLKQRGVDLLVIHGGLLGPKAFGEMTAALLARDDLEAMAQFEESRGTDMVFRVRR